LSTLECAFFIFISIYYPFLDGHQLTKTGGKHMSKARDTKKTEKKKAEKTLKEKRKEKRKKKSKKDKI